MGWFDLSREFPSQTSEPSSRILRANADQHAHNVWFEAQMEISRRNR